jgi:hypothetical protein
MKKLFAIVMVLAMALAIAAPALASGWDALPTDAPTFSDIVISITALETEENTSVLGSLYEKVAVMYPVVKGTLVHFYVEITIPKLAERSKETVALLANKGLVYKLSLTNLVTVKGENTSAGNSVNYFVNGTLDATHTLGLDAKTDTKTFGVGGVTVPDTKVVYGFEYWAAGVAAGKDGVAAATIGFYNTWKDISGWAPWQQFAWDNDQDGVNEFYIHANGTDAAENITQFYIYSDLTTGTQDYIMFPVKNEKIDVTKEIELTINDAHYFVNRATTADITFRPAAGGDIITPAATGYAAIKAAFDAYFTALGFPYADAKYMTQAHFTTYFGKILETSVKIVYPSGAVVVAPPAVEPPQTGDATTVVGFVMIALALVAAAAVTVKKVRA